MDEAELAWMTDLLLAVQPPLDRGVVAGILRRVKGLKTDTYVIGFADPEFPHDEGVVGQLDKAIADARQSLDQLRKERWNRLEWIQNDVAERNEYYTEHPEEAPFYEVGPNGYAPSGTPTVAQMQKEAIDDSFDCNRRVLLRKQNRLLVLKHLILTRGGR